MRFIKSIQLITFIFLLAQTPTLANATTLLRCLEQKLTSLISTEKESVSEKIKNSIKELTSYSFEVVYNEKAELVFKKIINNLNSPKDINFLLNELQNLAMIQTPKRKDGRADFSNPHWMSLFGRSLAKGNFLEKLMQLKNNFSKEDIVEFEKQIKELDKKIETYIYNTWDKRNFKIFLTQCLTVFQSDRIFEYLKLVDEYNKGLEHSSSVNVWALEYDKDLHHHEVYSKDSTKLFLTLPMEIREKGKKQRWTKFLESATKMETALKDWEMVMEKATRRNQEFWLRNFGQDQVDEMFLKLKGLKTVSKEEITKVVDTFYKDFYPKGEEFKTDRGNYSFAKVLDVAKKLQKSKLGMKMKKGDHLLIYGSFPNGKASMKSSDLDVHPNSSFTKSHRSDFETWQRGAKDNPIFVDTEKEMAKEMGIDRYEAGAVLQMIPDPAQKFGHDFFSKECLGIYNPILVTVTPDSVIVNIVDRIGNNSSLDLQIDGL